MVRFIIADFHPVVGDKHQKNTSLSNWKEKNQLWQDWGPPDQRLNTLSVLHLKKPIEFHRG